MADAERMYEVMDLRDPSIEMMEKEEGLPLSEYLLSRMMVQRMKWAIKNKERFRTIELKSNYPELTYNEIAGRLRISRRTVIRHLESVNLKIKEQE